MPYRETIFGPGYYYHIFCRGNEKRTIFIDDSDYERFTSKMGEYKTVDRVAIICYCLMPNHFHLLLRQDTKKAVSSFIHRLTVSYSMYFNKRYERVGHLFQGNFKAKLIKNDDYLLQVSRYIHVNPLKVMPSLYKLEDYPWSSYSEYLDKCKEMICDKEIILAQFRNSHHNDNSLYKRFVDRPTTNIELAKIRNFIIEPE